jgi:RHS repeat-associated protein
MQQEIDARRVQRCGSRINGSMTRSPDDSIAPTGERWNCQAELYDYGARFYDPRLASFLTHDPVREHANPYAYVGWNPVSRADPSGTFSINAFNLICTDWLAVAHSRNGMRRGAAASRKTSVALAAAEFIVCAMPLRPTSSKRASTCSPSNSCSDTATCVRPGATSTSLMGAWCAAAVPSICSAHRQRTDRRRPCRSSPSTGRRHRCGLSSARDHNPRKSRSPRSFENTVEHLSNRSSVGRSARRPARHRPLPYSGPGRPPRAV